MTRRDPWRYRCPHGHTAWESRIGTDAHGTAAASRYYCKTCLKYGHDPHFDRLHDRKTDHRVSTPA